MTAAETPSSSLALVVGLLACWAAVGAVVVAVVSGGPRRVAPGRLTTLSGDAPSRLTGPTARVSGLIGHVVSRGLWTPVSATGLEQAGIAMRLQDVLLLMTSVALALSALALLVAGLLAAVLMALVVPLGAKVYIGFLAGRRKAAFADQLDDTLQLLASSLRAGHSLLRAVDAVSREAEAPTNDEFARIINETRLGRDLGPALDDTATRMNSEDFLWVAQAVAIHREVGGNLAEVLDQVGETIRERNQIRRQVKALSAEGKLSAIVLMSLPVGVVGFLAIISPEYMAKFTQSALGYGLVLVAATLMTVGALWLRKVVSFTF